MIHLIGGAGFIGSAVSRCLASSGRNYRVFDIASSGGQYVDVTSPISFKSMPPAELVINLAAEHKDNVFPLSRYEAVNVSGAVNVCNYCRRLNINKIIFISSVAVYGEAPNDADETADLRPVNPYGHSKLKAENIYRDWYDEAPATRSLVIVRPTVVFGEGNRGNVFNLFQQIASRRFLMIGPGTNKKSMAYVENVAAFLCFLTESMSGYSVYNYVDGPDLKMNELVSFCREILFGRPTTGPRLPAPIAIFAGYLFDIMAAVKGAPLAISSRRVIKFLRSSSFSSNSMQTGFVPTFSLTDGILQTLNYEFLSGNVTAANISKRDGGQV